MLFPHAPPKNNIGRSPFSRIVKQRALPLPSLVLSYQMKLQYQATIAAWKQGTSELTVHQKKTIFLEYFKRDVSSITKTCP
jgi:hypothetical protein